MSRKRHGEGLERRYAYTVLGTDLVLTKECDGDQPASGTVTYGFTAAGNSLILFKQGGKVVSSYEKQ